MLAGGDDFFFLYGPVEVALPVYIAHDLHGSSLLLGAYWTAFGMGAVVGVLSAGRLRNHRLSTVVIIIGWGALDLVANRRSGPTVEP